MAPSAAARRPWGATVARMVLTTVVLLGPSLLVIYGGSPIRLTSLGSPKFAGGAAAAAAQRQQPAHVDAPHAGGAADASLSLASELAAKEAAEAEAAAAGQDAEATVQQQQQQPADDDDEVEEVEERQQRQEAEEKEETSAAQRQKAEKGAAAAEQAPQQQEEGQRQQADAGDDDEDQEEEEERQLLRGEKEEEEEEDKDGAEEEADATHPQGQQGSAAAKPSPKPAKQQKAAGKEAKPAKQQADAAVAAAADEEQDGGHKDASAAHGKAQQAKQQPAGNGHAEEEEGEEAAGKQQQQQQAKQQQTAKQQAKPKAGGGGGSKASGEADSEAGVGEDDYLEEEDEEAAVGTDDYLDDDDEGVADRGDARRAARAAAATVRFAWQNASLPVDARVEALLAALDPQQKVLQLQSRPGNGIPELGVPDVNWQEECMHGVKVGRSGVLSPWGATIYPINIAWAATFDDDLAERAASQIGDEMRAHYNRRAREGWLRKAYSNCFGPHVHIVRDPRWGRLAETFGEDPLLQSNMAVAHVRGLQGGDGTGTYLKASATCKHFIGNDLENWGNATRHNFDATIPPADMRDTFLPAFEACVREARAGSFMCSYNRVNGVPSCISKELLTDQLRGSMGFDGFVVTDCTAIVRMVRPEPDGPFVEEGSSRRASARALEAGTDMACHVFNQLRPQDVKENVLDEAVRRVLRARVRQGHLNIVADLPFPELNSTVIGHAAHKATAVELAAKGSVLLKNEGALPLDPAKLQRLAVLGPFANQPDYIMGKYHGATVEPVVTPLAALQAALPNARVSYSDSTALKFTGLGAADDAAVCEASDACILFLGSRMSVSQKMWEKLTFAKNAYDALVEGEGHDRTSLLLLRSQERLWQYLAENTTKPLIVVLNHGGPIDISAMLASPRISAVLSMWHPGQHGAAGVAQLLLGQASPSGRTPVTWYTEKYVKQLDMTDVRMRAQGKYPGRTYRYWHGKHDIVLFPFGYGLSYADWTLRDAGISVSGGARPQAGGRGGRGAGGGPAPRVAATAAVTVRHAGGMPADTSVLLFMRYLGPADDPDSKGPPGLPRASLAGSGCARNATRTDLVQRLVGYQRAGTLEAGASKRLSFPLLLGGGSRSSWAGFGSGRDPAPPCGNYALRFGWDQADGALLALAP